MTGLIIYLIIGAALWSIMYSVERTEYSYKRRILNTPHALLAFVVAWPIVICGIYYMSYYNEKT